MDAIFGCTSKGRRTVMHCNFEYTKHRDNANGTTAWRCMKLVQFHCKARKITHEVIKSSTFKIRITHTRATNPRHALEGRIENEGGLSNQRSFAYVRPCLPALAFVPPDDVLEAFDLLAESIVEHEQMNELLSFFEHTYVRKRTPTSRARRCIWPSVVQHHVMEPAWGSYRWHRSNDKRSWGPASWAPVALWLS